MTSDLSSFDIAPIVKQAVFSAPDYKSYFNILFNDGPVGNGVNIVFFNKIDSILRQLIGGRDDLHGLKWKKWSRTSTGWRLKVANMENTVFVLKKYCFYLILFP
jgi:hypothetical protein